MKLALISLLSLVCLQLALGASVNKSQRSDVQTEDDSEENKNELICKKHSLERAFLVPDVTKCIQAVQQIGMLSWKGWDLLKERRTFTDVAEKGKEECNKNSNTPEDLDACLNAVEGEFQKAQAELNSKVLALLPAVLSAGMALMQCMF